MTALNGSGTEARWGTAADGSPDPLSAGVVYSDDRALPRALAKSTSGEESTALGHPAPDSLPERPRSLPVIRTREIVLEARVEFLLAENERLRQQLAGRLLSHKRLYDRYRNQKARAAFWRLRFTTRKYKQSRPLAPSRTARPAPTRGA